MSHEISIFLLILANLLLIFISTFPPFPRNKFLFKNSYFDKLYTITLVLIIYPWAYSKFVGLFIETTVVITGYHLKCRLGNFELKKFIETFFNGNSF